MTKHFTQKDLQYWRGENIGCWKPGTWRSRIRDGRHFEIARAASHTAPVDWKLLYDSYLWREILLRKGPAAPGRLVLELLPGTSHTLLIALESIGMRRAVIRIDLSYPSRPQGVYGFETESVVADLVRPPFCSTPFFLIVGNHILDDLLVYLYLRDTTATRRIYSDPKLSAKVWASLVRCADQEELLREVVECLEALVETLVSGGDLVLRQYPSTFALHTGDRARISYVQETWFAVCRRLQACPSVSRADFVDLSEYAVPNGCKYPLSFFWLRK